MKAKKKSFWKIFKKSIQLIQNGGWHFTFIKKPSDIHYKLSNFLHHLEYEYSGLQLNDMKRLVEQKKILYDHSAQQEEEKYTGNQSLQKIEMDILPDYIRENIQKYKEWLD